MTFKTYCKLIFHVLVCAVILLSLPILSLVIFYTILPNWTTVVISTTSAFATIYWILKYIDKHFDDII